MPLIKYLLNKVLFLKRIKSINEVLGSVLDALPFLF